MTIQIEKRMSYTSRLLGTHQTGSVHSVYNKTINLLFGDQLIALQAKNSPLSPISLILELSADEMAALAVLPGTFASITDNQLILHNNSKNKDLCFSFETAMVVNSSLKLPFKKNHTDIPAFYEFIKKALGDSCKSGFKNLFFKSTPQSNEDSFLILDAAGCIIKEATGYYHDQSYANAADTLTRLIGLGIGLTPSGDDFLCGLLASIAFWDAADTPFAHALSHSLHKHLSNTNDISGAFLSCALQSHFSQAVVELPSVKNSSEIFNAFDAIGHSSGFDTLAGIYYGFSLCESGCDGVS